MRTLAYALVLAGPAILAGWPLAAQVRAAPPTLSVADDSTAIFEIRLADGTTLIGRIARLSGDTVHVRTLGGLEVVTLRRDVIGVRPVRGSVRAGEFWEDDPSDSRLFLGPTGRVVGDGRGYFGVYELFFASGAVGVGDLGMVSAGVSLIPGIDIGEQVFYIAPKLQVLNVPGLQGALGAFWVKPGTSEESAGLVFGTVTGGGRVAAATVALGFPFVSDAGFADDPLVMFGGELRVDRGLKLLSENWVVPGADEVLTSFGARILTSRLTVELGAATSTDGGGFLPVVSFSVTW